MLIHHSELEAAAASGTLPPKIRYHDVSKDHDWHAEHYHSNFPQMPLSCPESWLRVLACLSPHQVEQVASSCRYFRHLVGDETLWRRHCARAAACASQPLKFSHSWRASAFALPHSVAQRDVRAIPQLDTAARHVCQRHWRELPRLLAPSVDHFLRKFDVLQQPACLVDVDIGLQSEAWSLSHLCSTYGRASFSCSIQESQLPPMKMTLDGFEDYLRLTSDPEPIYLFEPRPPAGLLASLRVPAYFARDYASALEEAAHMSGTRQWLAIGGEGSGSRFHQDPFATS